MVIGVSPYSVPAPPLIDVTVLPDNEAVSNVWPTCRENMYGLFITTNKLHYVGEYTYMVYFIQPKKLHLMSDQSVLYFIYG